MAPRKLAKHAEQISKTGKKLYQRLHIFTGHFQEMRKGLERVVDSFNKAVGSFENRILVSARKFKDLGTGDAEIEILEPIEKKQEIFAFRK